MQKKTYWLAGAALLVLPQVENKKQQLGLTLLFLGGECNYMLSLKNRLRQPQPKQNNKTFDLKRQSLLIDKRL